MGQRWLPGRPPSLSPKDISSVVSDLYWECVPQKENKEQSWWALPTVLGSPPSVGRISELSVRPEAAALVCSLPHPSLLSHCTEPPNCLLSFSHSEPRTYLLLHLPKKWMQMYTHIRASGHEREIVLNWVIPFLYQNRAHSQIAADSCHYYFECLTLCGVP